MKRWAWLLVLSTLAGCVAPPSIPPVPRPLPFRSPLAPARQVVYLPIVTTGYTVAPISAKKGVTEACPVGNPTQRSNEIAGLRVAWLWNWGTQPPIYPGVESVPAIWDASSIGQPLGGNSAWLLGFNEPDSNDQANMTPEAAAAAWRRIEEAYPDRKLASPQVLHPGDWLERWYAAYLEIYGQAPRLDALAIHTYYDNSAAVYIARVQEYIALAQAWGVPEVWITEFSLAPLQDRSLTAAADDLADFVTWLEAEPMVTRYAPFTNRVECMAGAAYFQFGGQFDTPLYYLDGTLTLLGRWYAAQ